MFAFKRFICLSPLLMVTGCYQPHYTLDMLPSSATIAPGQSITLTATVSHEGSGIFSAPVTFAEAGNCGTVAPNSAITTRAGQAETTFTASRPAASCTSTVTGTARDGSGASTVVVAIAPSSATATITGPGGVTLSNPGTISVTATLTGAPPTWTYEIEGNGALYPAGSFTQLIIETEKPCGLPKSNEKPSIQPSSNQRLLSTLDYITKVSKDTITLICDGGLGGTAKFTARFVTGTNVHETSGPILVAGPN